MFKLSPEQTRFVMILDLSYLFRPSILSGPRLEMSEIDSTSGRYCRLELVKRPWFKSVPEVSGPSGWCSSPVSVP